MGHFLRSFASDGEILQEALALIPLLGPEQKGNGQRGGE